MKAPLVIDRARAAVLFVDLQEEHRQDKRYLVEGFAQVIDNVRRLQRAARDNAVPVYHSAYVVDVTNRPAKPFHPMLADGRSAFSDVSDPFAAICAEVGPAGDEIVLVKTDASAFSQGDMAALLAARQVEWLFVAGVWTEACIAATVKDAIGHGFRVVLVKDACGSGSTAMHQTAILNLANRLYGGAVVNTDAACRLLEGSPAEAWQVEGAVPMRFTYANAEEIYAAL